MRIDSVASSFDQAIGVLYQSVVSDEPWQQFMELFKRATGSAAVSIQKYNKQELMVDINSGMPPINIDAEGDLERIPLGVVKCLSDLRGVSPRLDIHLRKMADVMGVDIMDGDGNRVVLRLLRNRTQGDFTELEKSILARLAEHIVRAVAIYQTQINSSSRFNIYTMTSERLPLGIVALNDRGKIISCNHSAELIMGHYDCVIRDGQCLATRDIDDSRRLNLLVQKVIESAKTGKLTEQESLRIKRQGGAGNIYILIRALPQNPALPQNLAIGGSKIPRIAVYLTEDESVLAPPVKLLRQLFGLTKAEATLVIQMVRGLSLGDACVELGRSHNTGRSQLSSIFSKVGVNKQAELVRAVFNSVAALALSKEPIAV